MFSFTVNSQRMMGTRRPDGHYSLIARMVNGQWERLIMGGGVILSNEATDVQEVREYYWFMDRLPWVQTPA